MVRLLCILRVRGILLGLGLPGTYIYMKKKYIYIFAWVNSLIMIYVHDPYMQRGGPEGIRGNPMGRGSDILNPDTIL